MKRAARARGLALVLALPLAGLAACDGATAQEAVAKAQAPVGPDLARELEDCRREAERTARRLSELETALRSESEARLERERSWLAYTSGMARLAQMAGAPTFQPDVPAEERESRALDAVVGAQATEVAPAPAAPITEGDLERAARLAREERGRAVYLALRSLFAIEHVSGLDLLESGLVTDGATGPVVLRVLDERGRPLGSLYAERLRLEGSRASRTLTLVLESGWERRAGSKTPFEDGPADAEGRGGVRRIELPHVDPTPWFEALPELFREEQRARVTEGDPRELTALRFELNRRLRADASGSVYRLESVTAREGLLLREVRIAVLSPDLLMERELFADRMAVLEAEKGIEIELTGGSQVRGSEKVPFLEGRYRIFLPRAQAAIWRAAGIPVAGR